jgi:NitT/TauT family transport system permease protein
MSVLFGLWEVLPDIGAVSKIAISPFHSVIVALWRITFVTGVLWPNLAISARRAGTGYAMAIVVGIGLGMLVGSSPFARRWLSGPLEFFRQIPPLAVYPAFLLILGIGLKAQIAIVFFAAVWPILLNTVAGCGQVDPALVKAARTFGMKRRTMFAKVVLPSAVPFIATGLRLAGTYSLLVLVAAELYGAASGIGWYVSDEYLILQIPYMYAGILVIAIVGVSLNYVLVRFERHMQRWREHSPQQQTGLFGRR